MAIIQFPFIYPRLYKHVMDAIDTGSLTVSKDIEMGMVTDEEELETPSFLRQPHFYERRRVIGPPILPETKQAKLTDSKSKKN